MGKKCFREKNVQKPSTSRQGGLKLQLGSSTGRLPRTQIILSRRQRRPRGLLRSLRLPLEGLTGGVSPRTVFSPEVNFMACC